jgi:hypothetical protein
MGDNADTDAAVIKNAIDTAVKNAGKGLVEKETPPPKVLTVSNEQFVDLLSIQNKMK